MRIDYDQDHDTVYIRLHETQTLKRIAVTGGAAVTICPAR
jgi:uncharacterized protein YuzE